MLRSLYYEEGVEDDGATHPSDTPGETNKEKFAHALENRKPVVYSYWTFFYLYIWDEYLRWFLRCCCKDTKRTNCCGRKMHQYRKYTIARDRLEKEHDLYEIIRINRVTRALHRILLKSRQRRATDFTLSRTVRDQDAIDLAAERDADKSPTETKPAKEMQ